MALLPYTTVEIHGNRLRVVSRCRTYGEALQIAFRLAHQDRYVTGTGDTYGVAAAQPGHVEGYPPGTAYGEERLLDVVRYRDGHSEVVPA